MMLCTLLNLLLAGVLTSIPLWVGGVQVCNASPGPQGAYTASHCVHNVPPGYVQHVGRDLALLPGYAVQPQAMRQPVRGEHGTFRLHRGTIGVTYEAAVGATSSGGEYILGGAWPVQIWCRFDGTYGRGGDSGGGVYLADGALAGIMVAATQVQGVTPLVFRQTAWCGWRQTILARSTP